MPSTSPCRTPMSSPPPPRVIGQSASPVIHNTYTHINSVKNSKTLLFKTLLNLTLAVVLLLDFSYESFIFQRIISSPDHYYIVLVAECLLAGVLLLNAISFIVEYINYNMTYTPLVLSPAQQKLLGLDRAGPGVKVTSGQTAVTDHRPTERDRKPPPSIDFSVLKHSTPGSHSTPSRMASKSSPSFSSCLRSPGPMSSPYSSSQGSPARFYMGTPPRSRASGSFLSSPGLNSSSSYLNLSGGQSPGLLQTSKSSLRHHSKSPSLNTSLSKDMPISDLSELDEYLDDYYCKKQRVEQAYLDQSNYMQSSSFWTYGRSSLEFTPWLCSNQYQIADKSSPTVACSSSTTKLTAEDTDADRQTLHAGYMLWAKLGVTADTLDQWTENLRNWLALTILQRLVREIDEINSVLRSLGSSELQIGEVGISSLRSVALTKNQQLPSLNTVLPFLDVTANQEYLVARIRELSRGGCMSEYRWNGGGNFRGRVWEEDLPTDSMIVMHLFSTYMNTRLPPHPSFPDGTTFSSQHFMKTPDKPDLKKDNLSIYQTKINPPHYKLVIGDDIRDVTKGRNNMYYSILLLLHHIKTKHHGMLGRVNLGLSGVNVLTIFDD